MNDYLSISGDVKLGKRVKLAKFINLYGCSIGDDTKIGAFVEVQKNSAVGRKCKISSHTFICEGVTIGDNCFVGHGVVFINDNHPRSVNDNGAMESDKDWAGRLVMTKVCDGAAIGSNATILGGISIGKNAVIGAGSVVTKSVPAGQTWAGNPARKMKA
jgi:acetyltransferase-like isoleucine patch superfamily enzyme